MKNNNHCIWMKNHLLDKIIQTKSCLFCNNQILEGIDIEHNFKVSCDDCQVSYDKTYKTFDIYFRIKYSLIVFFYPEKEVEYRKDINTCQVPYFDIINLTKQQVLDKVNILRTFK